MNNNLINLIYNSKNSNNLIQYNDAIIFGEDGSLSIKGGSQGIQFNKVIVPSGGFGNSLDKNVQANQILIGLQNFVGTSIDSISLTGASNDNAGLLLPDEYKIIQSLDSTNGPQTIIDYLSNAVQTEYGASIVHGIQGSQGNQGNPGVQGTKGKQGTQGTQGNQGNAGSTGTQGNQGDKGKQGTQGIQGSNGTQGNQGNVGSTGTQGNQGDKGTQGTQGIQGSNGTQGNQGNVGSTGTQGNQGDKGTQGTQGMQGNPGTQGNQGNIGSTGTQGIQGSNGTQGNQGNVGSTGTQGNQGDKGKQGTQGIQGNPGAQGNQGNVGSTGTQGNQGDKGTQGKQGNIGVQGTQGLQGIRGTQGNQGPYGTQGNQGTQGTQGAKGKQGDAGNISGLSTTDISNGTQRGYLVGANNIGNVTELFTDSNIFMENHNLYTASDLRLKENLTEISKEFIDKIYNYDKDLIYDFKFKDTGKFTTGFIAQYLEELDENLIDNNGEYKAVNYFAALSKLVCVLIKKTKELNDRILELEKNNY